MAHFALIAPPFLSHVRTMEALAEALVARGHRTTLLHQADVAALVRSPAVAFKAVGLGTHPPGSLTGTLRRAARPGGPLGILRVVHDMARTTDMLCRELPRALAEIGADAVLADQMEAAGGLVAEGLGMPFVSVASALPINREPAVPLPFLPWPYDPSPSGVRRNRGGERVSSLLMQEHGRAIARNAKAFGLAPRKTLAECLSPLAQVSQTVPSFDFPRRALPAAFHHVGPLRPPLLAEPPLDLPLREDRPFVFASLGTLQGGRARIFRVIARACRSLDVQLLFAHCGGLSEREAGALGATWVTDFAPQRAALARASVAVTHGGLNTVLDALSLGVPLLAIPIAFDQPGVAARIVHAGAGERLAPMTLTRAKIEDALERLLSEPRYRGAAQAIGREIAEAGGAERAAGIILQALGLGGWPSDATATTLAHRALNRS